MSNLIRKITIVFFFFLTLPCFGQTNTAFHINGKLNNIIDGTKVFLVVPFPNDKVDSTVVKNNRFEFDGNINEPTEAAIVLESMNNFENRKKARRFSLEPAQINITETGEDYFKANIIGSIHTVELDSYYNFVGSNLRDIKNKLKAENKDYNSSQLKDSLTAVFAELNPTYYKSAEELYFIRHRAPSERVKELYKKFSKEVKGHYFGLLLKQFAEQYVELKVGDYAPAFMLPSSTEKKISLSSFKGKYLLINFWASWCKPCYTENKCLNNVYSIYKNKGLEILGIAVDTKENLKGALKRNQLLFQNVYIGTELTNPTKVKYGISVIPSNLLLDKTGKIIAKNFIVQLADGQINSIIESLFEQSK